MADVLPLRTPVGDSPADSVGPPLVVGAKELAALLRIGLRTVRTMDAAGRLPKPVRIGHSVRWSLEEIRAWLEAGAPDRKTWEARRAARK